MSQELVETVQAIQNSESPNILIVHVVSPKVVSPLNTVTPLEVQSRYNDSSSFSVFSHLESFDTTSLVAGDSIAIMRISARNWLAVGKVIV